MSFTIIHVSDLHWAPFNSDDVEIVVKAMVEDLRKMKVERDLKPDILIFSGDLAMGADDPDWLAGGYESLIMPIAVETGIGLENIFLSPGNHDIAREEVRSIPSLEKSLREKLTTSQAINDFMDHHDRRENKMQLARLDAFYSFHDKIQGCGLVPGPFQRVFKTRVNGELIGVACLNTAWRASGEADDVDYQKIVLGERAVDLSIEALRDCDFRIAVHHHPLDWLVPADRDNVNFLTRKNFDLSCCGHVHSSSPNMSRDPSGTCVTSQAGSVFAGRDWFNGYHIIEIDLASRDYTFHIREYVNQQRRFASATRVCDDGMLIISNAQVGDYRNVDQIELFNRSNRDAVKNVLMTHLNMSSDDGIVANRAITNFVVPPLYKRAFDSVDSDGDQEISKPVSLRDVLHAEGNITILGDSHSGKTGLAYHITQQLSAGSLGEPTIPIYIDARVYAPSMYGLKKAVRSFYDTIPKAFDLDYAINNGLFTIILDNVLPGVVDFDALKAHVFSKEVSSNRWIILGTPSFEGISPDRKYNEAFGTSSKYHLSALTRSGIRTIAKQWHGSDQDGAKKAYKMIMSQIVRDGLPKTPYIVSLLLWSIQSKAQGVHINESMLLGNMVDHLLGKADFRLSVRGPLNPRGKEITLENLAQFLKDCGGVSTENDTVTFLITFFSSIKLPYVGSDVLEKLIDCGILQRRGTSISFKYPCFQDFFFAKLMHSNRYLLHDNLSSTKFLDVRRELELLAGLRQENSDIIEAIQTVMRSHLPAKILSFSPEDADRVFANVPGAGTTKRDLNRIKRNRLTDDQVDDMMDELDRRSVRQGDRPVRQSLERSNGDVHMATKEREQEGIVADKGKVAGDPVRLSTYMAMSATLLRVLKNSDFTSFSVKGPALLSALEDWSKYHVLFMQEVESLVRDTSSSSSDPITDEELPLLMYIISKFFFNLYGSAVTSMVSTPTLSETLHSINNANLDSGTKSFILYLFEDIDDPKWKEGWVSIIDDRTSPPFVVDCLVQRLMIISQTRALDDNQYQRVKEIVDHVERRFGWTNEQKSNLIQNIKDAQVLATVHDNVSVHR